jgi:hypothetical protein
MTVQVIILLIMALVLGLYIRTLLTRKAVVKVIGIFYQKNALTPQGAKTQHELGLDPPEFLHRLTRPRDYRQSALRILMMQDIVVATAEGRLYLVEQRLDPSLRSPGGARGSRSRRP